MTRSKKNKLRRLWDAFTTLWKGLALHASADRWSTTELVYLVFNFCQILSGITMYPYQEQFAKRLIRSVLENDGEQITALFARQSGKTETVATVTGGMMIILPKLANMPMFADDPRLQMFKNGLWVGIFAPSQRQAQITYNRIRARISGPSAHAILNDPEFGLSFTISNGQTVALTNGSFATAISASDGSNIEGESFKLIICEETQDISNFKIRKSIHPMGAAYNASLIKIGTATNHKGDFYEAIQQNKKDLELRKAKNTDYMRRNHFEYDWKVVAKFNVKYAKYIEKEIKRLGEKSDEFRMSYCVTPETRILTADLRYVRADSIKTGDKLLGFDEHPAKKYAQRHFKEAVVEDVGVIERPCYKLTFEDGTVVTCSEEHRWLTFTAGSRTEWTQTKDLTSTDRVYRMADVWEEPTKDYKLGYLSAAFDGEGHISQLEGKINQLCFAQKGNLMLDRVKQYLTDFGFEYGDMERDESGVHKVYIKGGRYEVLRFLGMVRPVRLLNNFDANKLGTIRCCKQDEREFSHPRVAKKEFVGMQKVIPIRTSTRTYIAEGLASHNCLEWILVRGMFIDADVFEKNNLEFSLDTSMYDTFATHVAGIDVGGKGDDSTLVTITEVNWNMPVIEEKRLNEDTMEEETYYAYNTYVKAWLEIQDMPDYEEQYHLIMDFLSHYKIARVVCDTTRESAIADRMRANSNYEVISYVFTPKAKSELYKNLDREIVSGRARVPAGEATLKSREYLRFMEQMTDLQKGYSGVYMVVSHPAEGDAHDDYPDSWALSVWGCSTKGEVQEALSTTANPFTRLTQNQSKVTMAINRLTAARR